MTYHFKGHWRNDGKQDVEILNYDRKQNVLHKSCGACTHEEDDIKKKQRQHNDIL